MFRLSKAFVNNPRQLLQFLYEEDKVWCPSFWARMIAQPVFPAINLPNWYLFLAVISIENAMKQQSGQSCI